MLLSIRGRIVFIKRCISHCAIDWEQIDPGTYFYCKMTGIKWKQKLRTSSKEHGLTFIGLGLSK